MNKEAKIYVAGHRGLVGSAIVQALGGWAPKVPLSEGVAITYANFLKAEM